MRYLIQTRVTPAIHRWLMKKAREVDRSMSSYVRIVFLQLHELDKKPQNNVRKRKRTLKYAANRRKTRRSHNARQSAKPRK